MAAKTEKTSENERLAAEVTAGANEYVAYEGTRTKLLEAVTAKITAMATVPPVKTESGWNGLTWIVLIMLALATAVAIKKRNERLQNGN